MKYFGNAILFIAVLLLSMPANLNAQARKYTLSGQVFDSLTASPIKNPHVVVAGTDYTAVGDDKGMYKIEKLIPGTNNLIVWADGYDTSVVKFEIRKNLTLNVKLMLKLDTASLTIEETPVDTLPPPPPVVNTKQPKKKKEKHTLTEKDKEDIRVLIEDVIFSKTIYFSRFKDKRKELCVWGSFSIDTGYLYEFEAVFSKKNGFELKSFDFDMKGRISQ